MEGMVVCIGRWETVIDFHKAKLDLFQVIEILLRTPRVHLDVSRPMVISGLHHPVSHIHLAQRQEVRILVAEVVSGFYPSLRPS